VIAISYERLRRSYESIRRKEEQEQERILGLAEIRKKTAEFQNCISGCGWI